jgi:hypothetical protein
MRDTIQFIALCHLACYLKELKIGIYKAIILPVVLYGCETLPLALSEEHRLRLLEYSFLMRIFGQRIDRMVGGWRKFIMRSFITCSER